MPVREHVICKRCVMDTTDPDIVFDSNGICHHCHRYDQKVRTSVRSGEDGRRALELLRDDIRREGRHREYDCIIGVSGGVDSTYVAYLARQLELRPLAVHLDNGWNSEVAVTNISQAIRTLGIDLYTYVINWPEFRDLQLAFLRASTPDAEIPTDHAIVSLMYSMARRVGVRYVLTGYNVRTESHMTDAWSQGYYDWRYIRSVHRRFGRMPLKTFPHMNLWTYSRYMKTVKSVDVLNLVDYSKAGAMRLLESTLGWKYYGGKHFESIYTRFYQGYMLPRKWGFDKRRCHLSSLICAGETTREAALDELAKAPYPLAQQLEDRAYVSKKLGISEEEFERIMQQEPKTYWDYPSYGRLYRNPVFQFLRGLRRFGQGGGARHTRFM